MPAGPLLAASVAAAGLAYAAFNDRQQEVIDQADRLQIDQITAQFAQLKAVQKPAGRARHLHQLAGRSES
jgi:hypothetical protein